MAEVFPANGLVPHRSRLFVDDSRFPGRAKHRDVACTEYVRWRVPHGADVNPALKKVADLKQLVCNLDGLGYDDCEAIVFSVKERC